MSEEQKSEDKPRATLIKHRKEDEVSPPKPEGEESRKVVKKKVVIKKKIHQDGEEENRPVKHRAESSDQPWKVENPRPEAQKAAAPRPASAASSAPRVAGNLARRQGQVGGAPSPEQGRRSFPTKPGTFNRSGDRPSGGSDQQRSDYGPRPGGGGGYRGPGQGPGQGFRSGPGGPRPGGPRPPRPGAPLGGRPRPGAPPAPAAGEEKKTTSKKFKAKKKDTYQKKDKFLEKELAFKNKKSQVKTNPVPKEISIMEVISVSELAKKMNLKASDLIGKLMSLGMMVTINQQIDAETAQILAGEYGCKVNIVSLYDETIIETRQDVEEDLTPRSPIVTVMGHVDHGKTRLLDTIRKTNVVSGEAGGITQHIGAYQVETPGGKITFIDTPGHEAFTLMRARGAQVTDIVVLVVAATDGVMPQTIEALHHAKDAKVPIIVAINKVDLPEANPDRVKQQLADHGLLAEDWGGDVQMVPISALKGDNIDKLLEGILIQAEILELKANEKCPAEGKIIESRIDQGRGTVSTVLIERGTLKVGDSFVAGVYPGKVRALFNDRGKKITSAGPSCPVEVLGFTGIPDAGDPFQVTENERHARQVGDKRQELKKVEEAKNVKKITLDNLYDSIQEGGVQELKVIIKGDVHGSVEAIQSALEKLSTKEIRLNVIQASAGAINESDVMRAATAEAIIVAFHVRPTPKAVALAEKEKVEIRKYSIIYDVVEDIRAAMEGLLAPELMEEQIGTAEVRDTFKVPKIGLIAGAYITDGEVRRNCRIRLFRDNVEIHNGFISSLRRFKDDVKEVKTGYECGIGIENWTDLQVGDIMEAFIVKEVAKKLGTPLSETQKKEK